jgi:hypothetical protein
MKASQIITKRKVNNIIIRQSVYTSSASLNDLAGFRDFLFLLIGTKQTANSPIPRRAER